jgi:hypothetical protein
MNAAAAIHMQLTDAIRQKQERWKVDVQKEFSSSHICRIVNYASLALMDAHWMFSNKL